jgi:phenylacetate-CoA ligase
MIIIRGVNVFPSQIESTLISTKGVLPHYQIIVERVKNLDNIKILVEVEEELFSDEIKKLQNLTEKIKNDLKNVIGLSCDVKLVSAKTLQRSDGKVKRVIDKRVMI